MESTKAFSNVCYNEIEDPDKNSKYIVYSVTPGPLPFYIRTLSPKTKTTTDCQHEINRCQSCKGNPFKSFSSKHLAILLSMTLIITSSVVVYVIIEEFQVKNSGETSNHNQTYTLLPKKEPLNAKDTDFIHGNKVNSTNRTPCASRCIPYQHPKFESQCDNNYCICSGQNYQRWTCLPKVDDCRIEKRNVDMLMHNKPVSSYSCHVTDASTTHVISVYGNHFSSQTVVNLSSSNRDGVTIVLASHYHVRWKIKCTDVDLKSIILVSDRIFGSRDVQFDCDTNDFKRPKISSFRVPFGYGDDRYGMDTVNMLRVISKTIGKVKSFVGAEFADYVNVKI